MGSRDCQGIVPPLVRKVDSRAAREESPGCGEGIGARGCYEWCGLIEVAHIGICVVVQEYVCDL